MYMLSVILITAACPRGDEYAPLPNETIPGEVTDIDVKFVKVRKGHKEEWVARVKWTGPRGKRSGYFCFRMQ